MTTERKRGEEIRAFIVANISAHPGDIAGLVAEEFDISRQAANKHLQRLVGEGVLAKSGETRGRTYELAPLEEWRDVYPIAPGLTEERPWLMDVRPRLHDLPENVLTIWAYGFSEMFNNAIEHSDGTSIGVFVRRTAATTVMTVVDNGIGIFKKIQMALDLIDERHAPLELAKGKLTTDPAHHSGEGVFFTSRMFDEFVILSGSVFFGHEFGDQQDWILERDAPSHGTLVGMELGNLTARTTKGIFDEYSSGEEYGFTRTVVPVNLVKYGDENLVSRSQARRLLARFERFRTVVLDFDGVDAIGQAFADEVFRVFPDLHPRVQLAVINANPEVRRMIRRAQSHG